MSTKNLVSASISLADLAAAKNLVVQLRNLLPFLLSLTPDERRSGLKLGNKSVSFVEKVADYAASNSSLIPPYLDMNEFVKDFELTRALNELLRTLKPLTQDIEDTAMEAGVESLSTAMVFYNSVKTAAKRGVPGVKSVYEDLRQRFSGAGSGTVVDTPPAQ